MHVHEPRPSPLDFAPKYVWRKVYQGRWWELSHPASPSRSTRHARQDGRGVNGETRIEAASRASIKMGAPKSAHAAAQRPDGYLTPFPGWPSG